MMVNLQKNLKNYWEIKMKAEIKKIRDTSVFGMNSKYYKYYRDIKKLDEDECLVCKFKTKAELIKYRRTTERTLKNIMKKNYDIFTIKFRNLHDEIGFIILKEYGEIKTKKKKALGGLK